MPETQYKIIASDGREYGPTTLDEVCAWAAEGRLDRRTMVWTSDAAKWQAAGSLPELQWDLPQAEQGEPELALAPLRPAGFLVRFGAYLIDSLLVNSVALVLMYPWLARITEARRLLVEQLNLGDIEQAIATYNSAFLVLIAPVALYSILSMIYFIGFNGRFGWTPGKYAFGLRIETTDGTRFTYKRALVRYSAEMLSFLVLGLGYLMIAFHPEKRGLHDLLANTRVVYANRWSTAQVTS